MKKSQLSKIIKEETKNALLEQGKFQRALRALGIGGRKRPKSTDVDLPPPKPKRKFIEADEALNTPWEKILVSDPKNASRTMISDEYAEALRTAFGMKAGVDPSYNNAYLSMFNLNRGTPYVQGATRELVYKYATPQALIDDMNAIVKFTEYNPQLGLTSLSKLDSGLTNMVATGHRNFQAIADHFTKYRVPRNKPATISFRGKDLGIIIIRKLESKRPDFAQRVKNRVDDPNTFNPMGDNKGDIILAFPTKSPGPRGTSPLPGMQVKTFPKGFEPEDFRRILKNFMSFDFNKVKQGPFAKTDDVGVMLIKNPGPDLLGRTSRSDMGDQSFFSQALQRQKEKSGKYSAHFLDDADPRMIQRRKAPGAIGPRDKSGYFYDREAVEFYERIIRQEVKKLLKEIKNS